MRYPDRIVQRLADHLSSLNEDERIRHNASQVAESEAQHRRFKQAFDAGDCYLCDRKLSAFDEHSPCLHWFLRPAGVRKRHYPAVADLFGMMSVQSWLRWVANEGAWARNIADTADEDHIVQVTARYDDYEWSISCARTDFAGHQGRNSDFPHYHLQMKIKDRPFISYSDFHFPIHQHELAILRAMEATGAKSKFVFGESFDDLMEAVEPEWVVNLPTIPGNPEDAPFHMDTVLIADAGKTISGADLYEMFQRAKRDGVSRASLASTVPNATARTIITPGPGAVDPAHREGGRGSKR